MQNNMCAWAKARVSLAVKFYWILIHTETHNIGPIADPIIGATLILTPFVKNSFKKLSLDVGIVIVNLSVFLSAISDMVTWSDKKLLFSFVPARNR